LRLNTRRLCRCRFSSPPGRIFETCTLKYPCNRLKHPVLLMRIPRRTQLSIVNSVTVRRNQVEKQAKGQFVKVHLGLVLLLMIVVFTVGTTSAHATPSAQTTAAATVSAPEQRIFVGKVADTQAF